MRTQTQTNPNNVQIQKYTQIAVTINSMQLYWYWQMYFLSNNHTISVWYGLKETAQILQNIEEKSSAIKSTIYMSLIHECKLMRCWLIFSADGAVGAVGAESKCTWIDRWNPANLWPAGAGKSKPLCITVTGSQLWVLQCVCRGEYSVPWGNTMYPITSHYFIKVLPRSSG